nr:immunoglobulin heavy chain junction region [Macaca mulatta]
CARDMDDVLDLW